MTIYPITADSFETFSVLSRPSKTFVSSSTGGVTGSVYVNPRHSHVIKEPGQDPAYINSSFTDMNLEAVVADTATLIAGIIASGSGSTLSPVVLGALENYLVAVNNQSNSARDGATVKVTRYLPGTGQSEALHRALWVKEVLMPHNAVTNSMSQWAYTDYHCLNFYCKKNSPSAANTGSCLMYPQLGDWKRSTDNVVSGSYVLDGEFSFDFRINPRWNELSRFAVDGTAYPAGRHGEYHAGTIMHLSGCYAVTLHSGSNRSIDGRPSGFCLGLQLMSGTARLPSNNTPGQPKTTWPDFVFFSDDNSLSHNKWHRVVIRWGTASKNFGTGSFNIDGVDRGTFVIPSGSVAPHQFPSDFTNNVLCIGNFYEQKSYDDDTVVADPISMFFSDTVSSREGVSRLLTGSSDCTRSHNMRHPLNAEVHQLTLHRRYLDDAAILSSSTSTPFSKWDDVALFVPPVYVPSSSIRRIVSGSGGIPYSPFTYGYGSTVDPYNVGLFGSTALVNVNLENFCGDLANSGSLPRFYNLSMSATPFSPALASQDPYSYVADKKFVSRNWLVMPCDDPTCLPDYEMLLGSREHGTSRFRDSKGSLKPGLINLSSVFSGSAFVVLPAQGQAHLADETQLASLVGPSPESGSIAPGFSTVAVLNAVSKSVDLGSYKLTPAYGVPTSLQNRTKLECSTAVVLLNISNLYYGLRISRGTFEMHCDSFLDPDASYAATRFTVRDDGNGSLHRADCSSPATWPSIGNIFYDEGIIIIKDPIMQRYGLADFTVSFKGEQKIHSLKVEAIAPAGELNRSTNPSFVPLKPSNYPNDPDREFVYITGVNLHDENMNVVMKAMMAQPIVKRYGDRIAFRIRNDF